MKEKNKKVVNAILIIIMIVLAISIVSSLTIIIVKNTKFDKKNKPHGSNPCGLFFLSNLVKNTKFDKKNKPHGFDPNRTIDAVNSPVSSKKNNESKLIQAFDAEGDIGVITTGGDWF